MGESPQVIFSPGPWEIYCFGMIAEKFAFDSASKKPDFFITHCI